MVGYPNYFLDDTARESMETHLLKFLRDRAEVHAFICTDERFSKFIDKVELARLNITMFTKTFPGRRQFFRKHWCHQRLEEYAANFSVKFDWVVQTRPDLVYFSDVPDVTMLPKDRIYGRLRAAGVRYTRRWNLSSLSFSWDFSRPSGVACWGGYVEWQKDCIVADDQFNYIPWSWAKYANIKGTEWSGHINNGIPLGEARTVVGLNNSFSVANTSTGYIMCLAAYPGETYFTRSMVVKQYPYEPLHIKFHRRTEEVLKTWVRKPICREATRDWEELDSYANLCNKSSKDYKGNAGC
ncbi:hypothetical protein AAMO2058_000860200 [Amorphochlora amoebiformis]